MMLEISQKVMDLCVDEKETSYSALDGDCRFSASAQAQAQIHNASLGAIDCSAKLEKEKKECVLDNAFEEYFISFLIRCYTTTETMPTTL